MRLGLCSRTKDVVEPLIKPQWYVNCNTMAKEALDAVIDDNKRKIEIIPKQYAADWKRYLVVYSFKWPDLCIEVISSMVELLSDALT